MLKKKLLLVLGGLTVLHLDAVMADGWVPNPSNAAGVGDGLKPFTSRATLMGSIRNTRHNLTLSYNIEAPGGLGAIMDIARNNYGEICVYCHTPHGANTQVKAPIWNRTINTKAYKIYDKLRTLNRPIGQPGPNSLTCLSCHDGTISIDSVINMPGSGGYNNSQETTVNKDWLNNWTNKSGATSLHFQMGTPGPMEFRDGNGNSDGVIGANDGQNCTFCHSGASLAGQGLAPDFTVFMLGMDLRNDHPIGIQFPVDFGGGPGADGIDFNIPTGDVPGKMKFFDKNGNNRPDTNEPRLYDTGEGPEVECASCHDPHGIADPQQGGKFNPSFLRVNNGLNGLNGVPVADGVIVGPGSIIGNPSGLCLTCHEK